jgi:pentatricopeptide repeat protein
MCNHCGCHKTSDAEKLLDEMVSKELNPNIIHFNTLIAGFCRDNNMTETKRIFFYISRMGCVQGAVTYSTFISFLSKGGHFDRAYEICSESMPKI